MLCFWTSTFNSIVPSSKIIVFILNTEQACAPSYQTRFIPSCILYHMPLFEFIINFLIFLNKRRLYQLFVNAMDVTDGYGMEKLSKIEVVWRKAKQ